MDVFIRNQRRIRKQNFTLDVLCTLYECALYVLASCCMDLKYKCHAHHPIKIIEAEALHMDSGGSRSEVAWAGGCPRRFAASNRSVG